MDALVAAVIAFNWFALGYFVLSNSIFLALVLVAWVQSIRHMRRQGFADHGDAFSSPLTPGVSVVVPARDEEPVILASVRAMLALRYPDLEVVVVDDGSVDATFEVLRDAFDLVEFPCAAEDGIPTRGEVLSCHAPSSGDALLVVRKRNGGSRADALNAGINLARKPLVCLVDADSLLEEDALLRVVKPFLDDPERVVATGGVVRPVNGAVVSGGRVTQVRMPRQWVPRVQVVEYLRAFLLGRTAWSAFDGLLIISGAFGVFRRDLVVAMGGLDPTCIGEDCELVTRLHRRLRSEGRPYRVEFVPHPVSWTEVPPDLRSLAGQRRRWSTGLAQVLARHRTMIGNPRYGRIGMVTLPYYVVFEALGAVVEVLGLAFVAVALALGMVNVPFALLFAAASVGYGVLVSVAAIAVEEVSFRHYRRWRDLAAVLGAAVVENVGYRQLHSWWRLQGLWRALRRRDAAWGTIPRHGFGADAAG